MPTPKYERQAGAQELGGTVRLAGSDPVASSMQGLGSAIQGVGSKMMSTEKTKQANIKLAQTVKDSGYSAMADISRQSAMNAAETDFQAQILDPDSGVTIEDKPAFMQERNDEWKGTLQEGWKGTPSVLDQQMLKYDLKSEQEQGSYLSDVNKFQLERSVVAHDRALSDSYYNGSEEEIRVNYAKFEALTSPKIANQRATEVQTDMARSRNADLDSIQALEEARTDMDGGDYGPQSELVDEKKRGEIYKANTRRQKELKSVQRSQMVDNDLSMALAMQNKTAGYREIIRAGEERDAWDGVGDPSGISKGFEKIAIARYNKEIDNSLPANWQKKAVKFRTTVSEDNRYISNKYDGAMESDAELEKYIGDVSADPSLNEDQQFRLATIASSSYKIAGNPSLGTRTREAVNTMYQMESKAIAMGVSGVGLGVGGMAILNNIDEKSTPEQLQKNIDAAMEDIVPLYEKAIERELGGKLVGEPSAPDTNTVNWEDL